MKKLKICFLNLNAYSLLDSYSSAPVGGAEVQLFFLMKYLSENKNFGVSLLTGDWGQKEKEMFGKISVFKSISLEKKYCQEKVKLLVCQKH